MCHHFLRVSIKTDHTVQFHSLFTPIVERAMIEKKGEFVKYYSLIIIDLASSLMQIQGNEKRTVPCVLI